MSDELKVSFYLKREGKSGLASTNPNEVYTIVGRIIIGKSNAQFGSKLKIEESLWDVKSGRAIGKSRKANQLNREINKINLSIHAHYKEILKRTGTVTASEVKNAFQGMTSAQKTLLVFFEEIMQEFHARIGIDRSALTYPKYKNAYKQMKRFILAKYKVQDIPLNQFDLPFIETFDFHLRVERKMTDESVATVIFLLFKAVRLALHRNLITYPPFLGFKLKKPEFQIRSLTKEEFERLISTPLESQSQCFIRDLFVFAAFTGISYVDLKKLTLKDIITEEDGSLWICMSRQKTGIPFHVKLLDTPIKILKNTEDWQRKTLSFPYWDMAESTMP